METHESESLPELASQNKRIINFIIDNTIIIIFLLFLINIIEGSIEKITEDKIINLSIAVTLIYFFVMEYFFGQTIGKMFTKTMVVNEYGEPRTFKIVLIRTLCRQIPFEALTFIPNGMGFHDTLAKSRVINIPK